MGDIGNVVYPKGYRGFESLPLRLRHAEAWLRRDEVRSPWHSHRRSQASRHAKAGSDEIRLVMRKRKDSMYYIYSLKCRDGYYVGCTDDVDDRVDRHQKGHVPATANRLPVTLEFYFALNDKYKAFAFEKYLKSGSGRAFIKRHFL